MLAGLSGTVVVGRTHTRETSNGLEIENDVVFDALVMLVGMARQTQDVHVAWPVVVADSFPLSPASPFATFIAYPQMSPACRAVHQARVAEFQAGPLPGYADVARIRFLNPYCGFWRRGVLSGQVPCVGG